MLNVWRCGRRFIPHAVEAERIADHAVMVVHTRPLMALGVA